MFSPNSEAGACPSCHGLGASLACDPARLITDPDRPIDGGAMDGHKPGRVYGDPHGQHLATLAAAARAAGLDVRGPWREIGDEARRLVLEGAGEREFDVEWAYQRGPRRGVHRFTAPWIGLLALVRQEYERTHGDRRGEAVSPLMVPVACLACGGAKLKPEALAVRVAGLGIHQWLARTITGNLALLEAIERGETDLTDRARQATRDLRADLVRRLARLQDAGVSYLTLDRPAVTLSGGEAQRLRLAAALQSGLTGVCYVLDEPTVGLHARDTARLLSLLRALRDAGNTVVVVEHDLDVIDAADHVIELGPAAGPGGGRIVASGTPAAIAVQTGSVTGPYLAARRASAARRRSPRLLSPGLSVRGARAHNLGDLDIDVPSGGLVAVSGVSGSGKSSLVFDVIAPSLGPAPPPPGPVPAPVGCTAMDVHAPFAAAVNVGSAAAGTSPWSSPATLVGLLDPLRDVYAATAEASARNLRRSHFSTAVRGGRCETCEGLGRTRVGMDFLPDEWVHCEECDGKRFGPEVLACTIAGRSLADVLDMTCDEAEAFVTGLPLAKRAGAVARAALGALRDSGLGYVRLGQAARTLSGGERQRLVIAAALARPRSGPSLFLMDEPTSGLHMQDVDRLLAVFDRLIGDGHTVVAVEHHLGVVAAADWVIDLGPEGGDGGGRLVAAGTPDQVAANADSWTGRALAASVCS
jgi:excinuclease ABC subunit A